MLHWHIYFSKMGRKSKRRLRTYRQMHMPEGAESARGKRRWGMGGGRKGEGREEGKEGERRGEKINLVKKKEGGEKGKFLRARIVSRSENGGGRQGVGGEVMGREGLRGPHEHDECIGIVIFLNAFSTCWSWKEVCQCKNISNNVKKTSLKVCWYIS